MIICCIAVKIDGLTRLVSHHNIESVVRLLISIKWHGAGQRRQITKRLLMPVWPSATSLNLDFLV